MSPTPNYYESHEWRHIIVFKHSQQLQPHKQASKHYIFVSTCTHFLQPSLISSTDVRDLAFVFQFVSDSHNQVATLSGVITILFDTAVVAATTFNTLAFLRLRKWVNVLKDQSLVGVLIQQGVNISLLLDVLLKAKKVWSDMGKSHFMLSFIHLNIV